MSHKGIAARPNKELAGKVSLNQLLIPFSTALAAVTSSSASISGTTSSTCITQCHRTTGCDGLDQCFGGGFPSSRLIEISGYASSGRTSLCLSVAVMCALSGQAVLYLDATNAASSAAVLRKFCFDTVGTMGDHSLLLLNNLQFCTVFNYFALVGAIQSAIRAPEPLPMLVIDGFDRILSHLDPVVALT
jgi:predicted ATP-dependent serine protease